MILSLNNIPQVDFHLQKALTINQFFSLQKHAIQKYKMSLALMLESGGWQLARVTAGAVPVGNSVMIGIGTGNIGIGGLMAASRLAAWGYEVYLDMPSTNLSEMAVKLFHRAMYLGVDVGSNLTPKVFVDAYFDGAQKSPLPENYSERVLWTNQLSCTKVSLGMPTGMTAEDGQEDSFIHADAVVCMGAPQKMLYSPNMTGMAYVVDIGIPKKAFEDLDLPFHMPFEHESIVQMVI